jgi:hypothetical protein
MIGRLLAITLLLTLSWALTEPVAAQAQPPKVNEAIVKAREMNVETAEKEVSNTAASAAVRYLALKKLCESNYDEAKLMPLLMKALSSNSVPFQRLAITELAKRKKKEARGSLYTIVVNVYAEWQLRTASEAAIAEILGDDLPEKLKGSPLLQAQERDGSVDQEKAQKAVELYQSCASTFGASAPAPKPTPKPAPKAAPKKAP